MNHKSYKILVIGAGGMLGHTLFSVFSEHCHQVSGTIRKPSAEQNLFGGYTASAQKKDLDQFEKLIAKLQPDFVVNCVGVIKQIKASEDKAISILINALWPQAILEICKRQNTKLIHFSTDCIFSGTKGNYVETDAADARDLYGLTKFLGEVDDPAAITLRTSIIGHEQNSQNSLLEWFLSQKESCFGYKKAIYSGLTTVEMARFLTFSLFPKLKSEAICGVYHLSSEPISKFDLLGLIAGIYDKKITIKANTDFVIDRSLDSSKLKNMFGYTAPSWQKQIKDMYDYKVHATKT